MPEIRASTHPPNATSDVSRDRVSERMATLQRERLEGICRWVGIAYLPVAFSHVLLLPKHAQAIMVGIALACAAIMHVCYSRLRAPGADASTTRLVTWLVYASIIGHSLVRLHFAHAPSDMMFVGVIVVAIAMLPSNLPIHAAAVTGYMTGWSLIIADTQGGATLRSMVAPLLVALGTSIVFRGLELQRFRSHVELELADALHRETLQHVEAERQHAVHALEHGTHHDALTGMANRIAFSELLDDAFEQARQKDVSFAVLHVDLDRFKVVNDSLGRAVGDRLLQSVSERLARFVRPGDSLARFGGDEFGLLLSDLRASSDALLVAERLHTVFEQPFLLSGYEVKLEASIGVAMYRPDYTAADELLRDADIAMVQAKRSGDRQRVFDDGMREQAMERLQLEVELRRAIRDDQLELFYQPIIDMGRPEGTGVEALVRWRHPERGLLPPVAFLPLAEETGQMVDLGRWVFRQACNDLARWRRDQAVAPAFVSVNCDPQQLADPNLIDHVKQVLGDAGLDAAQLWIEITEGAVIANPDRAESVIASLRAEGVTVAVDDFGVGHSSLGYLQRFDFNVIKLDRSFVAPGRRNRHLVDAMVRVARGLDMRLLAEGLETSEDVERMQALGVELVQGYHFARPQPFDEVVVTLSELGAPAPPAAPPSVH